MGGYVAGLEKKLRAWPRLFAEHDLFSVDRGGWLLVWDLRPVSRAPLTALRGVDRVLYQACDSACDARRLAESVASSAGGPISPEEVARRLEPLLERGLMVRDGSRYLALAIPLGGVLAARPGRGALLRPREGRREEGPRGVGRLAGCGRRRGHPEGPGRPSEITPPGAAPRAGDALRLTASQFSVDARGEVRIRRVTCDDEAR